MVTIERIAEEEFDEKMEMEMKMKAKKWVRNEQFSFFS